MVQDVLSTLFQVITPLSIPVLAGAILVRFKDLNTKSMLTVVLYFLTPSIIFNTLTTAEISFEDLYMTLLYAVFNIILLWTFAKITGKLLNLPAPETAGLTLISTLTNCVNYGLPLVLLAFGKAGLDKATVFVVINMIFVHTFGIYFAARSSFNGKDAVKSVFSLPAIYAASAAIIFMIFDLKLPSGIEKGISIVADAYSPMVLLILGAQMMAVKSKELKPLEKKAFKAGIAARMAAAPLISLAVLTVLGIKGILFSVLFILSSMPVAVNSVILAEKFDASPNIVSKCILWTTLFSFLILPILIVLVS